MIHPLPSKAAPETRERWQKATEENLRQGYYLEIDETNREARWKHLWKATLNQDWNRVADIFEEYAPKYPNRFKLIRRQRRHDEIAPVRQPEPAPMYQTNYNEGEIMPDTKAPKTIVLEKDWYKISELVDLTGISRHTWKDHKQKFVIQRTGGKTSPIIIEASSVAAFLVDRGFNVELPVETKRLRNVPAPEPASAEAMRKEPEAVSTPFEEATAEKLGQILRPAIDAAYEEAESTGDGEAPEKPYRHHPIMSITQEVLPSGILRGPQTVSPWDALSQANQEAEEGPLYPNNEADPNMYQPGHMYHKLKIPQKERDAKDRQTEPEPVKEGPAQRLVMAVRDLEAARDIGDAAQISEAERQFNRAIFQARREADRLKEQVRQIELAIKRTRRRMRVLKVFGL